MDNTRLNIYARQKCSSSRAFWEKKKGCGAGMGPPRPVEKGKSLAKEQQIDPLSLGL